MADAASRAIASTEPAPPWVGQSIPRVEDAALLTGRGRFIDDLGVRPGTLHAAILRSPHAHADIVAIDSSAARRAPGVVAVLDGADIKALTTSLVVGVKAPVECWPIAVGRVRYAGEPVAIVVASDRYLAEDAVDLIEARYQVRAAVIDPLAALEADAPVLHDGFGGNVASDRSFRYGDPEQAFASAAHRISLDIRYPRNSCTPIETYGVVAEYDAGEDAYDVLANFQGPFSIHAVLSRALRVPGNRLRLRTPPDSGGSFGVKQGVFPYIVLIAAAARAAGRPVKWIEDRLEHLTASVSATNRATTLSAAVAEDGRILALDWDQVEDCGAHLRAPEPATLYRMHGNLTGAYDIRHLAVRNRVVVTNKTPSGLNRGFGGPQVYFALERLVQRIAVELGLDPLDVIRHNLIPAEGFPYRTASGATLDSGDYQEAIRRGIDQGDLAELKSRRDGPILAWREPPSRRSFQLGPFVPGGGAPSRRRLVADALEHGREMRLGAEPDGKRDLGQRPLRRRQQRLCVLDPVIEQIFARTVSGRCTELCGEMHPRESCNIGELGQADAAFEMSGDMLLDTPQAPFRQGIDLGARQFGPGQMHRKDLADAMGKLVACGIALLGERLGQSRGERIAQQNEVVEPFRSALRPSRREMLRRDVEVQESARRLELGAQLFRRRADIQGTRRHDAVEDDPALPGQGGARCLQRNADEISVGRRRRCVPRGLPRVVPSRDRDVVQRGLRAANDLTPSGFPGDCLRRVRCFVISRSGRKIDPGVGLVQFGQHRLFLLSFAVVRYDR